MRELNSRMCRLLALVPLVVLTAYSSVAIPDCSPAQLDPSQSPIAIDAAVRQRQSDALRAMSLDRLSTRCTGPSSSYAGTRASCFQRTSPIAGGKLGRRYPAIVRGHPARKRHRVAHRAGAPRAFRFGALLEAHTIDQRDSRTRGWRVVQLRLRDEASDGGGRAFRSRSALPRSPRLSANRQNRSCQGTRDCGKDQCVRRSGHGRHASGVLQEQLQPRSRCSLSGSSKPVAAGSTSSSTWMP